jgi:hypothetical protein
LALLIAVAPITAAEFLTKKPKSPIFAAASFPPLPPVQTDPQEWIEDYRKFVDPMGSIVTRIGCLRAR